MKLRQFPEEISKIIQAIFRSQFGFSPTDQQLRMIKIFWNTSYPNWTEEELVKDFIEDSNPDAFVKLINLCIQAYKSYPLRKKANINIIEKLYYVSSELKGFHL